MTGEGRSDNGDKTLMNALKTTLFAAAATFAMTGVALAQDLADLVEAPSRQPEVARVVLGAGAVRSSAARSTATNIAAAN